ncbi:hypothetical protein Tco_0335694 [Tanacetum coccineum]
MAFGGSTRDLGSFGEETNKITDLHQIHEEVLFTERGDGVASIKRRCRDLSSDGVRDLATTSGRGQLKEDLESSTALCEVGYIIMAGLLVSLYIGGVQRWFRGEVLDTVELRSMTVGLRTELQERIVSRGHIIHHLENVRGCPTYGWLKRLKENQREDVAQLGLLNVLVDRAYAIVHKRERDVAEMDY